MLPSTNTAELESSQDTFTLKKALANGMALFKRCVNKSQGQREALPVFGVHTNDERDVHGLNTKNPGGAGAFGMTQSASVVAASEYGDQVKQVYKEVKNIQI